jgi:hypothetical protein
VGQLKSSAILADVFREGDITMAQPVKGVSNPPQSETQAVQPTPVPRKQSEKTAAPPKGDTVQISSAGRAASAGSATNKSEKS